MIRRIAAALALLVPAGANAQLPLPHRFVASANVSLRIWVPSGTVRVETWDRDSIMVTGTIAKSAHFYGGGSGRGAKLGIENNDPKDTRMARGDLVVTVPRKAHVWVKMTDGEVLATHTAGELEVITVAGSITIQDASGVVSVETIDAAVKIAGVSGEVRVRGGGGNVELAEIHGTLTVATVSGKVDLSGASMPDARIETIGGRVALTGGVMPTALVEVETHNGGVVLSLNPVAVPWLTLSTRGGVVRNNLGAGSIKAGRINVRSFSGNINVFTAPGIELKKIKMPP